MTYDDPATHLLYRLMQKPYGQPFDLAQWAIFLWFAYCVLADPNPPKVSPGALMFFATVASWTCSRLIVGSAVLTLRFVWRIVRAIGGLLLLLGPARQDY